MTPRDKKLEEAKREAARLLGRLGGLAKSQRKTEAVRENARQPRPNARKRRAGTR